MRCRDARSIYVESVRAADEAAREPAFADAMLHLAGCPACRARLDRLAAEILTPTGCPLTCAQCAAEMHRYVEAELAGLDPAAQCPAVHDHVASCPDCAEALRATSEAIRAVEEAPLAEAVRLWFLPSAGAATTGAGRRNSSAGRAGGYAAEAPGAFEAFRGSLRLYGRLAAAGAGGFGAMLLLTMGAALAAAGVVSMPPVRRAIDQAWRRSVEVVPDFGSLIAREPTATATPTASPAPTATASATARADASRSAESGAALPRSTARPRTGTVGLVTPTSGPTPWTPTASPEIAGPHSGDGDPSGREAYPGRTADSALPATEQTQAPGDERQPEPSATARPYP